VWIVAFSTVLTPPNGFRIDEDALASGLAMMATSESSWIGSRMAAWALDAQGGGGRAANDCSPD
jgi:hypothetical protein